MSEANVKIAPLKREDLLVELRGFEPLTFCMPCLSIPSGWVASGRIAAGQNVIGV